MKQMTASKQPVPPDTAERIPELDGFRVLMIFIVSWFHIWQQSWLTPYVGGYSLDFLVRSGYMPVDATILLSSFLLFLPYAKAARYNTALPDVRTFYRKRIMRIVPSYMFANLLVLCAMALPFHQYYSLQDGIADVVSHVLMIFPFSRKIYMTTKLASACWTVVIEMQAYLFFPWVARAVLKKPVLTLGCMLCITALFRSWSLWTLTDYNLVVNQLPNFLDVYVMGILCAMLYVRCREWMTQAKHPVLWQLLATVLLIVSVYIVQIVLHQQAHSSGHDNLQAGQMLRRPQFAGCMSLMLLCLPFCVKPVRLLFGNRVTAFLSSISLNYYLLHQSLAVFLRKINFPYSELELPNQAGERAWQYRYTFWCFFLSLLLAILLTWLVEKPGAAALKKWFAHADAKKKAGAERYAAKVLDSLSLAKDTPVLLWCTHVPESVKDAFIAQLRKRNIPCYLMADAQDTENNHDLGTVLTVCGTRPKDLPDGYVCFYRG